VLGRGHATGDTVLLLLGGSPASASATAEQLRAIVAADPIVGLDLTVSIGVAASAPGAPFVWDDVFRRADAALYRAKADGRDRVTVADPAFAEPQLSLA